MGKESACNAGDLGSIPGLGRSPGDRNSSPLQYPGLENSMDYRDGKELDMTDLTFTFNWSGLHHAPALGVGVWGCLIPRGVWGTTW